MKKTGFTIIIDGVEKYLSDFDKIAAAYKLNLSTLKKLEIGTKEYYNQQKIVAEMKAGLDSFNVSLKKQTKLLEDIPSDSVKALNKEFKEQKSILEELEIGSEEYNEQLEVVGRLKNEVRAYNKTLKDQAKEYENIEKGVSIYKELEKETRDLKNESKELAAQMVKLAKAGKKNTDEYKDLESKYKTVTAAAQEFDATLKEIDEVVGDNFRKVGDYKESFKDAFESAGFGVDGLDAKMKALAKNPFLLLIAVLVGIVVKLGEAFKKSEEGTKVFGQGAAAINGVMSSLVKVSVKVFEWVQKIFVDNQENIQKFGKFVEEEVLNRIYGLIDGFGGLAKVVKKVFEGDFAGAKKAAEETGEAFKNMLTGDEDMDGVKGKVKDLTDELKKQGAASMALDNLRISAAQTNRNLQKSLQNVLDKEAELQALSDEEKGGIEKQIALKKELLDVQVEVSKIEVAMAKNTASVINKEISIRRANKESVLDLLDTQTDAYVSVREAERELTKVTAENALERYKLSRDAFDRQMDFLVDGVDTFKAVNERILTDETVSYGIRQQLLKDTKTQFDKSFNDQIELIEKFTGVSVDGNDLISESNDKLLGEKVAALGIDDIVAGRLLEVVRDRRAGVQDLIEAEKDLLAAKKESDLEQLDSEINLRQQLNEIRFKKGLINQLEYNKEIILLDIELLNKQLGIEDKKGNESLKKLNEIELKKLELKEASIELDLSNIDKKQEAEIHKQNQLYLAGEINAKEHEARLSEIKDEANEEKLEYLEEKGDENLELVRELLDKEVEEHKSKNEKILADEEETRQKKIGMAKDVSSTLQSVSDGLFAALIANAEGNEEKQLKLQRKQFNINKVFSATNVVIDTAAAVAKVMAQTGTLSPFVIPLIVAQGAAQLAVVLAQAPPMAGGGFTGRGMQVDETGQKSAGLFRLHENEYVAPAHQVNSNPALFAALNENRAKGGSFTVPNTDAPRNDERLLDAIKTMNNNIRVVADPEEILRLGTEKRDFKKSKNL